MERIKGINDDGQAGDGKAIKQIGTVDPIKDFKEMVEDRKVDRTNEAQQ